MSIKWCRQMSIKWCMASINASSLSDAKHILLLRFLLISALRDFTYLDSYLLLVGLVNASLSHLC